jgi:MoxR-like ATPase
VQRKEPPLLDADLPRVTKRRRRRMVQNLNPESGKPMERVLYEVKKVIVGQDHLLERLIVALLARGHILVEGVPGLAKTMAIKTLAEAIGGEFKRIQFTPDLVPADLIGTRIYNQKTGEFNTSLGPVFTNLLLADEINRAPAKVQSALLEVMQERQVTIGRETFRVPNPFLVLATQNPIETEGTYPLPEAQVDRFMLKVVISYPSRNEERKVVDGILDELHREIKPVLEPAQLADMKQTVASIYMDDKVKDYVLDLVSATRDPKAYNMKDLESLIEYGASPRASINLCLAARANAFLSARGYVTPQDVKEVAYEVLRHRVILSYEAEAEEKTSDDVVKRVLESVPVP